MGDVDKPEDKSGNKKGTQGLSARTLAQPKMGFGFTSSCAIMPAIPIIYQYTSKEGQGGHGNGWFYQFTQFDRPIRGIIRDRD